MDLLFVMGVYLFQVICYRGLARYLYKPEAKPSTFSLTPKTDHQWVEADKELRSYKIGAIISGGLALAFALLLPIEGTIKATFLIVAVALGFLVASIRFNDWYTLMNHRSKVLVQESQPPPSKNHIVGLVWLGLWLLSHWIVMKLRSEVSDTLIWVGIAALGFVVCAFYAGYNSEHLVLYRLKGADTLLPDTEE
jgi:hypothetical protein